MEDWIYFLEEFIERLEQWFKVDNFYISRIKVNYSKFIFKIHGITMHSCTCKHFFLLSKFVTSSTRAPFLLNKISQIPLIWSKKINVYSKINIECLNILGKGIKWFKHRYLASLTTVKGTPMHYKIHSEYRNLKNIQLRYVTFPISQLQGQNICDTI